MRTRFVIAFVAACPLACTHTPHSPAEPPNRDRRSIDVSGTQRSYLVSLPEGYDPAVAYPLVFAFHGLGDSGARLSTKWYFRVEFESNEPAIFVYPDGLETGQGAGWANDDGRDVAFFDRMLATLRSEHRIDDARVFAIGPSYGGIMANTLACRRAPVLRGIAAIGAAWPYSDEPCTGPVAAWLSHGNPDPIVAYAEGLRAREQLALANGCNLSRARPVEPAAHCVAYACPAAYPLIWCEHAEGHRFPEFAAAAIRRFVDAF